MILTLFVVGAPACGPSNTSPPAPGETASLPQTRDLSAPASPVPTAQAIATASRLCPDAQRPFVTDFEVRETPAVAEPPASVNPDFTRIVFTSNWGRSGTGEVEMFMIQLPPDWPEQLP